jgi:methylmalonyl-CoA epimerase
MTLFTPKTKVGALNHVGIAVTDLDASLRQFQELYDSPETQVIESVELGIKAAFIEQGETHIELLQPLRVDTVIGRFIDAHGEGIHHMAFTVGDVDAKVEQLLSLGIPIIDGPRAGLRGRIAFSNPSATHGVLIELVTPPQES